MTIDEFIARWKDRPGGYEKGNAQIFLGELAEVLALPRPAMLHAWR